MLLMIYQDLLMSSTIIPSRYFNVSRWDIFMFHSYCTLLNIWWKCKWKHQFSKQRYMGLSGVSICHFFSTDALLHHGLILYTFAWVIWLINVFVRVTIHQTTHTSTSISWSISGISISGISRIGLCTSRDKINEKIPTNWRDGPVKRIVSDRCRHLYDDVILIVDVFFSCRRYR